jgi:predicted short-subunit dehydrogenase-like oxidoreductase (DUF2520 family)
MKTFTSFAILGSGRVARHFAFYLESLALPVVRWSRNGDPRFNSEPESDPSTRLQKTLAAASHVLLAVKDDAIAELVPKIQAEQTAVHFSGALSVQGATAAHPLMTFGPDLESLDWYRRIPFVIDEGASFEEVLPGLKNPHFAIAPSQRSYYHALCALAGNSTFLLWKTIGSAFENELSLPRELLAPFLHQVVTNSSSSDARAFTGPVARGDWDVVRAHLDSLHRHPQLLQSYRTYLQLAKTSGAPVPEGVL